MSFYIQRCDDVGTVSNSPHGAVATQELRRFWEFGFGNPRVLAVCTQHWDSFPRVTSITLHLSIRQRQPSRSPGKHIVWINQAPVVPLDSHDFVFCRRRCFVDDHTSNCSVSARTLSFSLLFFLGKPVRQRLLSIRFQRFRCLQVNWFCHWATVQSSHPRKDTVIQRL